MGINWNTSIYTNQLDKTYKGPSAEWANQHIGLDNGTHIKKAFGEAGGQWAFTPEGKFDLENSVRNNLALYNHSPELQAHLSETYPTDFQYYDELATNLTHHFDAGGEFNGPDLRSVWLSHAEQNGNKPPSAA